MPLTLQNVRLTPYDATEAIPAGFKVAGEFKTRRAPSPMQYNWYSRWESVAHEVFHLLATALATKPEGYTLDELKALYPNEADKAEVDKIINKFKGSWDHRHTGFDLVISENATPERFMLIWRDPRTAYAKEIGLEGDFSAVPHQKTPSYVEKVPQLIEEARNPKPVVEKAPKAEKAPRAPKAPKAVAEAQSAPAGGYKAMFASIPAPTIAGLEGDTVGAILDNAIAKFVDPNAVVEGDAAGTKVIDKLNATIDANGIEGEVFVDLVAKAQKQTAIKSGFYKICKDLAKVVAEYKKNATVVSAPAATDQPVAAQ